MVIRINGKEITLKQKSTLAKLIAGEKLSPEKIVVEYNLRIVPKQEWQAIRLKQGDRVEIVSFVAGG